MPASPTLGGLPEELASEVLKSLDYVPDIAHLGFTCRKYFRISVPILYAKAVARLEEEDANRRFHDHALDYSIPFKMPPLIWGIRQGLQTTIQNALIATDRLDRVHVEIYPTLEHWKSMVRQHRHKARQRLRPSHDTAHLRPALRPWRTYQLRFSSSKDPKERQEYVEDMEDRPAARWESVGLWPARPMPMEITALHVAAQCNDRDIPHHYAT